MSVTDEQFAAIHTQDKNLVVVAGAGSGKTHVLVERYITLLKNNPDWPLNALVAITFTREAALEMRNRVRQKLEEQTHAAAKKSEQIHWSDLLAQMDSARINTIHGLCATILRANAAQAGVDPTFDVLDEVNADILLNDTIAEQLQQLVAATEDDTSALFTEYDMHVIRDVLTDPDILAAPLDDIPGDAKALHEAWSAEWAHNFANAQERLANDADFMAAGTWEPVSAWPAGDKLAARWEVVHQHWDDLWQADAQAAQQACEQIISAIKLNAGSQKNWGSKEILDEAKAALGTVRERLKAFMQETRNAPADLDEHAAVMLVRWYRLIQRVQDAYRSAKAAQSVLDFNDLETLTADLLTKNPEVRARYQGVEFKHLLVDEFQDTNAAQWQIVKSLADIDGDAALFVVGDMKQSIYGFRGADVRVFGAVRREIANLRDNGVELKLSRSFRSHPGLINIFNKLFAKLLQREDDSPVRDYQIAFDDATDEMDAQRVALPQPITAHYHPVELILLRRDQPHLEDKVNAADRRLWEANLIAERLHALKKADAPIFDKQTGDFRNFDYGDAAILFQSTSNINDYESVFKMLDVPFVTIGGRGYYNRQEVWDVLNLLRALYNAADDLSLAAALRSPMFGFSDDMLLALRLLRAEDNKVLPLAQALIHPDTPYLSASERGQVQRTAHILARLREQAGRVTISELLRQALVETGYLATLTGLPGGARLRRNIEKLVDIAEQSGKITLGEFAYYLNDLSAREVREGEAALDTSGAVRLMSVHASKGLEFPVVILADAGWTRSERGTDAVLYDATAGRLACKVFDHDENKFMPSYPYHHAQHLQKLREEAERKRLLYVAATRARDCLIISGEVKSDEEWNARGWLGQLLDAFEIEDAQHQQVIHYAEYGTLHVALPPFDEGLPRRLRGGDGVHDWPELAVDEPAPKPPRMRRLNIPPERLLGHIAATQLADIGGLHYADNDKQRDYYRQNLRRQILDAAPAQIREAIRTEPPRYRKRQVGEVVHEALRYWRFPQTHDKIDAILRSYAWQQRITDEMDVRDVVAQAHRLLNRFQDSALYHEIAAVKAAGRAFFAELSFIFRTEKRILHGVIDALYQREDGSWAIVDYKSSFVPDVDKLGQDAFAKHAQHYHLQVGAYASAVHAEVGTYPAVYIHYIRYGETVHIPADVWQAEIANLEHYIGDILGSS